MRAGRRQGGFVHALSVAAGLTVVFVGCADREGRTTGATTGPRARKAPPVRRTPTAPKATRGVRCELPAGTVEKIRAAASQLEVDPKDKAAWIELLLDRCKGWPSLLKDIIAFQSPRARAARRSLMIKMPTDAQRKELGEVMDQVCPELTKRFDAAAEKGIRGSLPGLWEHCRFAELGVMTKREYVGSWVTNVHVMVVYRLLRDGGMRHRVARTLARLVATRGRWREGQKEGEMFLSQSSSRTESVPAVEVTVSASVLLVDNKAVANVKNGRVDANTKRDGPDGYFIDPLYKALAAAAKKRSARARQARQRFVRQLLVFVHRSTPWKLLADVLYTAGQAGFHRHNLAVNSRLATDAIVLVDVARTASTKPPPPTPERVVMTPSAYQLQNVGGKVARSFPAGHGQRAAARQALAKALYARQLKRKPRAGRWGVIHVKVGDTIKYDDVIQLLDVLRAKPGPAGKGGCWFAFSPKVKTYLPASAARPRCLFPYPNLQLVAK